MKINIPTAIIIGAIIVSIGLYLASLNDPLAKCMDKILESTQHINAGQAARACSGAK